MKLIYFTKQLEGKPKRTNLLYRNLNNFSISFGDISSATMFQDMDKLIISGIIMFTYMQIVLSKFSWVEFRVYRHIKFNFLSKPKP